MKPVILPPRRPVRPAPRQKARPTPGNRPTGPEFETGRAKVADDAPLSPSEALALGEALATLVATPGWRLFDTLLTRMQNKTAIQGIRDPKASKDYVAGKLDFIDELRVAVATYIAEAEGIAAQGDRATTADSRVISAMIPGGARSPR